MSKQTTKPTNKESIIYNEMINVEELRVIYETENFGILKRNEALKLAEGKGLDLVLVSISPPVGKICDVGKHKYDKERAEKENKKTNKAKVLKQINLRPKISQNDLLTKLKKANEILSEGDRVMFKIKLKNKELKVESNVTNAIAFLNNIVKNQIDCIILGEVSQDKGNISVQIAQKPLK